MIDKLDLDSGGAVGNHLDMNGWMDRIICGDAREMSAVPDGSVSLAVTSPPYNVSKDYTDHTDNLSLEQYSELLSAVWRECYRILRPGGRLCINVANTDRKPYLSLVSLIDEQLRQCPEEWLHRGHLIWDKGASAGVSTAWGSFAKASNPTLRDVHEYITIWSKDQFRLDVGGASGITGNEFVAWTRSIWRPELGLSEIEDKVKAKLEDARKRGKDDGWLAESIARAIFSLVQQPGPTMLEMATATGIDHPAPYPAELPKRLILLYSAPGDVVLDPFMGSGSTAVAAVMTERHFVGYEISARYCAIAEQRITLARESRPSGQRIAGTEDTLSK